LSIPDPLFQPLNRFVGSLRFEPARRSGKPVSGSIELMFDLELQDLGGERLVVWIDQVLVAPLPTKLYTPSYPFDAIRQQRSGRVAGTFVFRANRGPRRFRASSTPAAEIVFRVATATAVLNTRFEAPTADAKPVEIEVGCRPLGPQLARCRRGRQPGCRKTLVLAVRPRHGPRTDQLGGLRHGLANCCLERRPTGVIESCGFSEIAALDGHRKRAGACKDDGQASGSNAATVGGHGIHLIEDHAA
jgi:hypothetical protein